MLLCAGIPSKLSGDGSDAILIFLSFCFLAGCANIPDIPDSSAPPVQRKPLSGAELSPIGTFVNLGEPIPDAYIVHDVTGYVESSSWRWTRKRPELRFFLDSTEHLKFKADLSIADGTLKDTGPVTISIFINSHPLNSVKYATAGRKQFEKLVPAAFLHPKAVNFAALEIDKVLLYFFNAMAPETSPDGVGYHLGLVSRDLRAHGFERITTNMHANLSPGIEMLFLFAFAFGRHSAAAPTHFAFLVTVTFAMLSYARRFGFPVAGVCGALLVFVSPAVGLDGSIACNDVATACIIFTAFYLVWIWP